MKIKTILKTSLPLALALAASAWGQFPATNTPVTPGRINYQGRLTAADGSLYSNNVYTIEFRIWDASTAGNLLWGATYTTYAKDGYFNVILGAPGADILRAQPTNATYQAADLWKALWYNPANPKLNLFMGITCLNDKDGTYKGTNGAVEAFPRQQLLCSPFAERAQMAQYAREAVSNFYVPKKLTVNGQVDANSGMDLSGGMALSGGMIVDGPVTNNNGLTVNGSVTKLNQGLEVAGSKTYLKAGAEVTGSAELKGGVNVTGNAAISDSLTAANNVTMHTLNFSGSFAGNWDKLIDYGNGYVIYGDNVGRYTGTSRLWISATNAGEVIIGPRENSTPMKIFEVRADSQKFEGGTINFTTASSILVGGSKPFMIRRYSTSGEIYDWFHNTGVSATDWSAGIIGFDYRHMDVNEYGSHWSYKCQMYMESGVWKIHSRSHSDGQDPGGHIVDVLFIRRVLVDDNRSAGIP